MFQGSFQAPTNVWTLIRQLARSDKFSCLLDVKSLQPGRVSLLFLHQPLSFAFTKKVIQKIRKHKERADFLNWRLNFKSWGICYVLSSQSRNGQEFINSWPSEVQAGAKQEGIWQWPWRMEMHVLVLFEGFLAEQRGKPVTKLEIKLPYDSAIPHLGTYPKKMKTLIWKDIWTQYLLQNYL